MFTLITGGARSGKSALAERLAGSHGARVLYIATSLATDDEMAARIAHHRAARPASWRTYEGFTQLDRVIAREAPQCDAIMLECVTTLITNLLFAEAGTSAPEAMDFTALEASIQRQLTALAEACRQSACPVYVVTNEVGMGIVPEHLLARRFRDIAGRVNQRLAADARQVYLVVSGIEMKIKG
ncbi:bifunctional adenosylcobinamide kinase/adenosylcobinamide-phosphate guanylyltransferase [Edwardsiella tarda]